LFVLAPAPRETQDLTGGFPLRANRLRWTRAEWAPRLATRPSFPQSLGSSAAGASACYVTVNQAPSGGRICSLACSLPPTPKKHQLSETLVPKTRRDNILARARRDFRDAAVARHGDGAGAGARRPVEVKLVMGEGSMGGRGRGAGKGGGKGRRRSGERFCLWRRRPRSCFVSGLFGPSTAAPASVMGGDAMAAITVRAMAQGGPRTAR
jgi:hypothetical protein